VLLVLAVAHRGATDGLERILPGRDLGVVFNTKDLLFGLEEYQGGVGIKISGDKMAYRGLVDVFVSSVDSSLALALGAAAEHHLSGGRVSPYLGATLTVEVARLVSKDSASDTRTESTSLPVSVGGMFGVEIYATRFLSVFAEYGLSLTLSQTWTIVSTAGVEERSKELDWWVDTGLGNQSRIGIVAYFAARRDLHLPRL
jgi:hypothetical protein